MYWWLYVCVCVYLSVCLSVCLSSHLSVYLSIYLSVFLSASLKTNLFCETSSVFELDNIKNAAILRDVLNFWTWQHQKRNYSARLPRFLKLATSTTKQFCETSFDNGKLSAEVTASCQCVLRFFQPMSLKYCACHEKVMPGHTKRCTCHTKLSSQTEGLKFDFLHFLQTGNPRLNKQQIIIQQPKKMVWNGSCPFKILVCDILCHFWTRSTKLGLLFGTLTLVLREIAWACL